MQDTTTQPDTKQESTDSKGKKAGKQGDRFPWLLFLAYFIPMAVLVVVIGISLASLRLEARIKEMQEHDISRLDLVSGFLGAEVFGALKHLRSIATEAVTRQALDSQSPENLQALESSFLTLAQRNPQYRQIRWIDESGFEKVRITRNQGGAFVVDRQELQDKSSRYYFQSANVLLPGELYISRLDLNMEHGRLEVPPHAVLRIVTPVRGSNRKHLGMIIINIDMEYLFNLVYSPEQSDSDVDYYLVNQKGVQVNGELGDIQNADELEKQVNFNLAHPRVWEEVLKNDAGSLKTADGMWVWETSSPLETYYRAIRKLPPYMIAFDQLTYNDFSLVLMSHRPIGLLDEVRRENRLLISLGIIFILSVYCLSLFFFLTGQARARKAEVDASHAMERAANLARMKELEERFHRLVEASSIGQLVVDSDGRIEISNPAAEHMLGYEKGELEGLSVDKLLPDALQEKHVHLREQFMQAPETRRMGPGRSLHAVRKDGSTIPVEIGLNPYSDHGRSLVLASIIDLTTGE